MSVAKNLRFSTFKFIIIILSNVNLFSISLRSFVSTTWISYVDMKEMVKINFLWEEMGNIARTIRKQGENGRKGRQEDHWPEKKFGDGL
jgi:hypothetical protein